MSTDHEDLTEIKVSTARIEEQVKALNVSTSLQHSNLSEQMGKLARKEDVDDVDIRVTKLENVMGWVIKGLITSGLTAIVALSGIARKVGL